MIEWISGLPLDPETEAHYAALRTVGTTVGNSFALRSGPWLAGCAVFGDIAGGNRSPAGSGWIVGSRAAPTASHAHIPGTDSERR